MTTRITIRLLLFLFIILSLGSCKKDSEVVKDFNKITFTDGGLAGFTYTFPINKGFYAQATQTTKSILLIFGDDDQSAGTMPGTGECYFYYSGEASIDFLSPEGQIMRFTFDREGGSTFTIDAKEATITFDEVTDTKIRGKISGEFHNSATTISTFASMDFSMELAPVK